MADVSQVIQMQRLRASAARRPVKNDKSITHLYQHQVTSSGIAEFLPNSKTKNTDGRTIKGYYYVPGKQAKPKVLPINAFTPGSVTIPPVVPPPFNLINIVDLSGVVLTGLARQRVDIFGNNRGSYSTEFVIQFTNIDPSFANLAYVTIQGITPTDILTSTDTISYTSPNYTPTTIFDAGPPRTIGDASPPNISTIPGRITTSTIMTITSTNPLDNIIIFFV